MNSSWWSGRQEGIALLLSYVSSHAFIHDDHWLEDLDDVDELSGHPLLLKPPLVVTSRADPISSTSSRLFEARDISSSSSVIRTAGPSVLTQLSGSSEARRLVASLIANRRLDISAFYSDRPELRILQSAAERHGWRPTIQPTPAAFSARKNHVENLPLLRSISNKFPKTVICRTKDETQRALNTLRAPIYCKTDDSRTFVVNSLKAEQSIPTPSLLQEHISTKATPTAQWIQWRGQSRPLFVLDQLVEDGHHFGNVYSQRREGYLINRYSVELEKARAILPSWEGVLGLDFVETGEELIPIDLNARFNSSTIPFVYGFNRFGHAMEAALYLRHEVTNSDAAVEQIMGVVRNSKVDTTIFGRSATEDDGIFFSFSVGNEQAIINVTERLRAVS